MKGAHIVCIIVLNLLAVLVVSCTTPEPIPPTPTPTPTPEPTPTCPTESEQRYFDSLRREMRSIGAQSQMLGEDFARASENISLLFDEVWAMGIENTLYTIDQGANNILALSAPGSATSVHRAAQKMARTIQTSMDFYEQGIANLDVSEMEKGADFLTLAGDDAQHVSGLMATFCVNR